MNKYLDCDEIIDLFYRTFLIQITEVPPDFDEFFKENFWNLLA